MENDNVVKYTNYFMNIRNNRINSFRNLTAKESGEFMKIFDIQTKFEDRYLGESRICKPSGKGSLMGISISDLSGIHRDVIINNLKTKFYDRTMMEEVRCLINTIIDIEDGDGVSERARIQMFMEYLKRFGAPSAYNYALKGDIKTNSRYGGDDTKHHEFTGDMFVIKCPREPINAKELIHELVCGTGALNNLREYIPNFSYVYDAFYCSAPIVNDDTKEVISWCQNSENSVSYVIYENVQNPSAFGDIAKDKTPGVAQNFIKYMGQTSLAEYLAEIQYGFAHCDLHGDNALISGYRKSEFYIPYVFNGEIYYVPSPGGIVMFIDYGMSRVVIPQEDNQPGISVGKLDSSGFFSMIGVPPNDGMAIADIHKLLCFILRGSIVEENEELATCVSRLLLGYFYKDQKPTMDKCMYLLKNQWNSRYHVPPEEVRKKNWNMVDFIKYLNDFANQYGVKLMVKEEDLPKGSQIFGNLTEESETKEEIREELGIEVPKIPSLFDLSQNPTNEKVREGINKHLNVVLHDESMSIHNIMNTDLTHPFYVIGPNETDLETNLQQYIESIQDVAEVLSICSKLKDKLRELQISSNILGKSEEFDKLNKEVRTKLDADVKYILKIRSAIKDNYETIQKFIFGKVMDRPLNEDEVSHYAVHYLFNLYDKYNKVTSIINNM